MLPRVSAALAKNLSPLSATPPKTTSKQRGEQDKGAFQKYQNQQKQERPGKPPPPADAIAQPAVQAAPIPKARATAHAGRPGLKVIKAQNSDDDSIDDETVPPPKAPIPFSTAEVFLQLFQKIQDRKQKLLRWLGFSSYKEIGKNGLSGSTKGRRRGVKLRKGTMIDHKAE